MAAGGLFGQGFGQAMSTIPDTSDPFIPLPDTDMIYAVITGELGLFGAAALLLTYMLLVARGFKAAILARDSFSKLLAAGLSSILAIQVFVIVGGVTRVIPFTGVTLPFVSYGGSSILANFMLVALLLLVSDRRRRPERGDAMNRSIVRLFGVVILLFACWSSWTSRWTVFNATALQNNPLNKLAYFASLKVKRGQILADNGDVLAKSVQGQRRHLEARHTRSGRCSPRRSATTSPQSAVGRARVGPQRRRAARAADALSRSSVRSTAPRRSVMTSTRRSIRRRRRWRASCWTRHGATGATSGSVVAIVPQTGAVKVMYSNPTYNDNNPQRPAMPPGIGCQSTRDAGRTSAGLDVQARHDHRGARHRQVHARTR